ncbi:MAG: hypothetical protein AVDCRST_MAG34-1727, partial [uncultured Nocardioidaceae bacterium]
DRLDARSAQSCDDGAGARHLRAAAGGARAGRRGRPVHPQRGERVDQPVRRRQRPAPHCDQRGRPRPGRAAVARGRDLHGDPVARARRGHGVRRHPHRQCRRPAHRPAGAGAAQAPGQGGFGHRGPHRRRRGVGRVLRDPRARPPALRRRGRALRRGARRARRRGDLAGAAGEGPGRGGQPLL